jgi:hypothetical protein
MPCVTAEKQDICGIETRFSPVIKSQLVTIAIARRPLEFLDLTSPGQVVMYDDGVGASAFLPLALLGGAFGWGLKRNVSRTTDCRLRK